MTLPKLRDLNIDGPGPSFPPALTISIPMVYPFGAAFVRASPASLVHIQRHQAVRDKPKHLGQYLMIRVVRKKRLQRDGFCYHVFGHG